MKQPVELRRIRDFGEIINDSFAFLKENFKPLFTSLFAIVGFFVVAGAATTAFTQMSLIGTMNGAGASDTYQSTRSFATYGISAVFNAIILVLGQLSIYLVTLSYMALYLEKKGKSPTLPEVWGFYKYYFLRILGSGFVTTLLFVVGFVLCVLPGFYLMVPLSIIFPIIVIENASFGYAFNKAFRIIKDSWWTIFGVIFVTTFIIGILGSLASVPLSLISTLRLFLSLKSFTLPLIIAFSAMQNILLLTYTLPAIAITLCYFSVSEQKDGTGILNRIEMFGKSTDDSTNLPAEEY
jgi:hypothetical protein